MARAAPSAVRLVVVSPSETHFVVDVPEPSLVPLAGDPSTLVLGLDGYETRGRAGSPGLPARVVLVALPPVGDVSVRAMASGVTVRDGVLLAPVPGLVRAEGRVTPVYHRDDAAYAARGSQAPERARLAGVGWMRNQRVARIEVMPEDYDASARRLTLARTVEVTVTMPPAAPVTEPAEQPDPFERVYARALVNYEQGRSWRRPAARAGRAGAWTADFGLRAATPHAVKARTMDYAGRQWVKLAVSQPGFYKVDFGTLRNLRPFSGATMTNADLRLFSWRSPMPVLPEQDYCDTCAYAEIPIGTPGGDNVVFSADNSNYFYFFAMGPSDWADLYNPARPDTTFFTHPYETKNYYYLTFSTPAQPIAGTPLRIPVVNADTDTSGSPLQPATFPERVHYEVSNQYFPDSPPVADTTAIRTASGAIDTLSWQKWFWTTLGQGQNYGVQVDAPGADLSQPVRLRAKLWGLVKTVPDQCLDVTNVLDASFNGVPQPERVWPEKGSFTYDLQLASPVETGNSVALSVPNVPLNNCSVVGLGWVDLFYARRLQPVGDSLTFVADSTLQRTVYRVAPFSGTSPPRLFDVTDMNAPVELQSFHYLALDATHYQLAFATDGTRRRRFRIVPDSKIPRLLGANVFEAPQSSMSDLHQLNGDYIVIYFDGFGAAAESLAAWRHVHLPLPGVSAPYDTATVPISALYDQFSGGRTDPLAIRNFLRAVFLQPRPGRRPSFVELLGDASYDFKNITGQAAPGQPACLLPTYENGYDWPVIGGHQFTTDDWLLNVDNTAQVIPDFFGGRIPVDDPQTAIDVVRTKVLAYERTIPFGEDRNRVMLIADDNVQCTDPDPIGWGHLRQTASLDQDHTPPHIDRKYVYIHTYPYGQASCSKPDARADIRQNIQNGVAIMNYIGHGSPFQLADEAVFILSDVGTLQNAPLYPLFVAASCDVGLFNDPYNPSLGERMMATVGGGAIAVVSSTQLAFSNSNALLNGELYDQIFDRNPASGGQYHTSIAEALLAAKESGGVFSLTNDMKYQLMGDAGTVLNLPKLWVELAFQDTLGNPVTQVARGQTVKFSGRVLDSPGGNPVAMNGTASVLIEDSAPLVSPPSDPGDQFYFRAGPVYRADVAVNSGALSGRFVMPLEARQGPLGRVRAYATGRSAGQAVDNDGVGSQYTTIVCDTCLGRPVVVDTQGPHIELSFEGGTLEVRPTAVLNVDLFDQSGILITGHTPQNGIIVTVDGNSTTRKDITPSFRYAANSYQGGRATFPLPNLATGLHTIEVSAADNLASGFNAAAHRSTASLQFKVVSSTSLSVTGAYLFPDPASSTGPMRGGQFVVDAPGVSVNVLLRIYTVSGKLIRTLKSFDGANQVQLPWDGLDDEKAPLANGVYLFKVNVNEREPDGSSSSSSHAVTEGRFVVLNR